MSDDNLTREEAAERARLISDVHYDVDLDVRTGDERFTSITDATFACAEPGVSTFIDLDATGVSKIVLNGRELPHAALEPGNRIRLDGLEERNSLRVEAECEYQHTGTGLHHFRDPVDDAVYLHSQFEPFDAHRVYACFDQPDIKATFELSVHAPPEAKVVSNAPVASHEGNTWRFERTKPVSTYITALCTGPYHVVTDRHRDIDLGLWCRESLAKHLDPDELFEITKQGFDFFESAFDYPYPFGKYDQVFCPEYKFGAMENAGCVTFTEHYIFRSRVVDARREGRAETILHEMAHMWFGDLVTMRWWDDLWLNESFATYMALVAMVEATRFRNAWTSFATDTKGWAYREDQLPTTHPIVADIADVHATHLHFDGITYAKGASVLKQLVAWVGTDAFYGGLRDYFRTYEYGNADLRQFLEALERGSGRDLGSWTKEWLQTAGVNTVSLDVQASNGALGSVAMRQLAPPEHPSLRSHRIAVGVYDDDLNLRRTVSLDLVGDHVQINDLHGEPKPGLLLPNQDDLAYTKIRLDEMSLETAQARLSKLGDPLARALCWMSMWDMVRDAELPARRYLEIVLAHVGAESDIGTMQNLLAQASTAANVYGDRSNRAVTRARIAEVARASVADAQAGSDEQLVWARAFASAASSSEDLATMASWLDGTGSVDGLAIDTDLRWHLVICLATAGVDDAEARIDTELERDPTDLGRRFALQARAAVPTEEAKAEAWRSLLEDDLTLATVRSVLAGFNRYAQDDLLEPYVDRYFERVDDYWTSRGIDLGIQFAEGAYPVSVSERTITATESHLGRDVPPPLRRILLEESDDVRRILRARTADASAD